MTEKKEPNIIFPCEDYVIKSMGDAEPDFQASVEAVVESIAPGYDRSKTVSKLSAKGNYMSGNVWITATGTEQLETLNTRLREDSRVKMVL